MRPSTNKEAKPFCRLDTHNSLRFKMAIVSLKWSTGKGKKGMQWQKQVTGLVAKTIRQI